MKRTSTRLLSIFVALMPIGCGLSNVAALIQGTGTSGKSINQEAEDAVLLALRGRISHGSGTSLQGWSILAMPNDGSGGRFAEIDNAGFFSLRDFDRQKYWTLTLFSPDTVTQAVLSIPNQIPRTISQYFKVRANTMPELLLAGSIIQFTHLNGLDIGREIASDTNGDGVPDGMININQDIPTDGIARIGDGQGFALTAESDTDLDGLPNSIDTDIDGDGVINALDADDDGDAILDVFDLDADGNLIADSSDSSYDRYRNDRHVFLAQVEYRTNDPAPGLSLCNEAPGGLRISVETNRFNEMSISVIGAYAFLAGAMVKDDQGNIFAWDRSLRDDGMSDDGFANDGIFSRVIYLDCDKHPQANLAVIVHAESPSGRAYGDYPLVFSSVRTANSSIAYEPVTRSVQLVGNPFGEISDFLWIIQVQDQDGAGVYVSNTKPGSERVMIVPENIDLEGRQIFAESFSLPKTFGRAMYRLPTVSLSP